MKVYIVLGISCLLFSGCTTLDSNTVTNLNNRLTAIEDKLNDREGGNSIKGKRYISNRNNEALQVEVPVTVKVLLDIETETSEVK